MISKKIIFILACSYSTIVFGAGAQAPEGTIPETFNVRLSRGSQELQRIFDLPGIQASVLAAITLYYEQNPTNSRNDDLETLLDATASFTNPISDFYVNIMTSIREIVNDNANTNIEMTQDQLELFARPYIMLLLSQQNRALARANR